MVNYTETAAGERFSLACTWGAAQVARPAMAEEMEATVREMLREILEEEGGL